MNLRLRTLLVSLLVSLGEYWAHKGPRVPMVLRHGAVHAW
jgi:hypothetical protein